MWIDHRKEIRKTFSEDKHSQKLNVETCVVTAADQYSYQSAVLLEFVFTVANSRYQPRWQNQIILLYSPPTQHHSFFRNLPPL